MYCSPLLGREYRSHLRHLVIHIECPSVVQMPTNCAVDGLHSKVFDVA